MVILTDDLRSAKRCIETALRQTTNNEKIKDEIEMAVKYLEEALKILE